MDKDDIVRHSSILNKLINHALDTTDSPEFGSHTWEEVRETYEYLNTLLMNTQHITLH